MRRQVVGAGDSRDAQFGRHILALLENLLEYSGLEQGTLQAVMEPFNVRELFLETSDMLKPLTLRKNLHLEYDVRIGNEVRLVSDPLKIRQIVMNLLSNAVKYTPQGAFGLRQLTVRGCWSSALPIRGRGFLPSFLRNFTNLLPGVWKIVIMRKVRVSVCLWSKDSSNC